MTQEQSPASRQEVIESLRWKKFGIPSDGFIALVDVMGDDASIAQAARVSYGNDNPKVECTDIRCFNGKWQTVVEFKSDVPPVKNCELCEGVGFLDRKGKPWREKDAAADRDLIRYLMRHRHTTPFEMVEIKFLVRVPMDCWRQWIRHRTANVNEYSTRYAEAIDSMAETPPDAWRLQAKTNKQGSDGLLTEWPEKWNVAGEPAVKYPPAHPVHTELSNIKTPGDYLSSREEDVQRLAREVYIERVEAGVALEQARKDLPLSTYTEAYWKCDLHNIFNFLSLRMDSHAQKEIRDYANAMGSIVQQLFPFAWEAFVDYRLNAITLSAAEVKLISEVLRLGDATSSVAMELLNTLTKKKIDDSLSAEWRAEKCRERDECFEKLKKLGILEL